MPVLTKLDIGPNELPNQLSGPRTQNCDAQKGYPSRHGFGLDWILALLVNQFLGPRYIYSGSSKHTPETYVSHASNLQIWVKIVMIWLRYDFFSVCLSGGGVGVGWVIPLLSDDDGVTQHHRPNKGGAC